MDRVDWLIAGFTISLAVGFVSILVWVLFLVLSPLHAVAGR